jgi:hypothetical protein
MIVYFALFSFFLLFLFLFFSFFFLGGGGGGGGCLYFSTITNLLLSVQMAVIPRNAQGHGWLRPAIGVVELSQCIIQVRCALRHL